MGMGSEETGSIARGRVTLADIARLTGLNLSTVSRALSRPGRVNAETRQRVEDAASQLGYATNLAARSLSRGRAETLMVMLSGLAGQAISPVLTEVLRGVSAEATAQGYGVFMQSLPDDEVRLADVAHLVRNGMVDGALLLIPVEDHPAPEDLLSVSGLPVVATLHDQTRLGFPSVIAQEAEGFRMLVDHLLIRGHRRFGFLGGPERVDHDVIRFDAVRAHLAARGLAGSCVRLEGGPFDMAAGRRAAQRFTGLAGRPTAVLACSDTLALGFMRGVMEAGLRVPQDVAVTGYDGLDYGEFSTPSLTTLRQPSAEIGRMGTRLLIERCMGRGSADPQHIALPTELVLREST